MGTLSVITPVVIFLLFPALKTKSLYKTNIDCPFIRELVKLLPLCNLETITLFPSTFGPGKYVISRLLRKNSFYYIGLLHV